MSSLDYCGQLDACQFLMNSLIHETEEMTSEVLGIEIERVTSLAQSIFFVQGDASFQVFVSTLIQKISAVKPGRKLLSWLYEKGAYPITIKKGYEDCCDPDFKEIRLRAAGSYCYNGLFHNQVVAVKGPSEVVLAHELIHLLHAVNHTVTKCNKLRLGVLPDMDDLEEQHTITGYNHDFGSKRGTLITDLKLLGLDLSSLGFPEEFSVTEISLSDVESAALTSLSFAASKERALETSKLDTIPNDEILERKMYINAAVTSVLGGIGISCFVNFLNSEILVISFLVI